MRFSTKLFLLVILAVASSNLLLFSMLYIQTSKALFKEVQSNATSIAATAASMVDGDVLASIRTRADESTAAYGTMVELLRKIRDANRRSDFNVAYLYTMMASPDNPNVLVFGVDSEARIEDKSHVGDVYKGTFSPDFKVQDKNYVDETPSRDQWGEWITACAPVRKKGGDVESIICADIGFSDVKKRTTSKLTAIGMISLSVTLLVALSISMLLTRKVSKPIHSLHHTLAAVGKGDFDIRMESTTRDEFGEVALAVNSMVEGLRQRELLKGVFARYVSEKVLDAVLKQGERAILHGERRKITVLFSDIRNFTDLSEQLSPEEVVCLLNEYFEAMVDIVFKNHGTLDKFIGDGMMVIFGAPDDDPFQEENAVRTALEMRQELKRLCEKWKHGRDVRITTGIGINTGVAIVGNIGSQKRMEYTAIGDTVNFASRMEAITKETGHSILVSDYTYVSVRNQFNFKRLDNVMIKGKKASVVAYAVLDDTQDETACAFEGMEERLSVHSIEAHAQAG